jgi:dTDP-4-dehydrorhamnose 3,5-epimerase
MLDFSEQKIKNTSIDGLFIIERPLFGDERGFFREVVRIDALNKELNLNFSSKQWNHSMSKKGVIRGIHAEGWNKIIYPLTGKVFMALADIRPESKTFSKVETFVSDENNRFALFVTNGIANSFCNFGEDDANYLYLVDNYYDGFDKKAVAWDDPDLNIKWPVENPILSERDKNNPKLRDLFPDKL